MSQDVLGFLTWPAIGLAVIIAIFIIVRALAAFYVRVPPNKAAFFFGARSGKKGMQKVSQPGHPDEATVTVLPPGTVVVTGGGRIRKPIIEAVQFLDLTEISLPQILVKNMPNVDGVLVTVEAVANIRFKDDAQSLLAAGSRFLGMSQEQVQSVARETLESNLRGVVGTLTVDQLIKDRDAFRQKVLGEAGEDLARLGMQIDVFNPQSITDEQGYIEALGKKRTAEVKRDATIGEAQALAEAKKKATDAEREAEVVAQENMRLEAEAQKNTEVARQTYQAEIARETAVTQQAGPLSTAEQKQKVIVAEVKIEEERSRALISVEAQNILKEQKSQEAEIVVPAKAKADAQVREAEGYKVAQTARADGDKYATIARADAEQHKRKVEGEGMAAATKATGLAEADVIEKQGIARAVSVHELAKAYQQFNEAALTLEVIKVMPQVIQSLGTVFGSIAAPMGNIDKLVVVDSGGGGKDDGALNRFTKVGPTMLFQFLEQAKAAGIDVGGLLNKIGVKTEDMIDNALSQKSGKKSG
jgi:flotillin